MGQLVQVNNAPDDYSNDSCITGFKLRSVEFKWMNEVRDYEFSASVTDFHNNVAYTPVLSVHQG